MAFRESFEGLKHEPNSPLIGAYFIPGSLSEFPFQTGLSLVHPIPNEDSYVLVGDFGASTTGPKWDLGPNGIIAADDVPEGKAFIGLRAPDSKAFIEFDLNTTVHQVSALVTSADVIGLVAYDAKGKEIAAASVNGVEAAIWKQNFISLSAHEQIHSIAFTGTDVVIDQVFFSGGRPTTVNYANGGFQGPPTHLSEEPLILRGSDDPDELLGGKAGDTIYGAREKDKIYGGDGNDLIIGAKGKDKLWGDEGQDTFMFKRLHNAPDRLKDFDPDADTIVLAGDDFKGLQPGWLDAEQFSDGAVTKDTRVHYNDENGKLSFIAPGDSAKPVVIAKLDAGLDLGATDILVG
jgi:hypothetical protein